MKTIKLTASQAIVRFLIAQSTETDRGLEPLFPGVWAIFGHGNVAGLGEALYQVQEELPTYRGHNEQSMAHAAIAFAKARKRQQVMVCTASAGPGSVNMVTAAAVAHSNRLPVLFLPGDTFATRAPDPVLQQVENFHDATLTSNDCFKPVVRLFDRITRPEQLITALPQVVRVLTDDAECGPVCLAMPQDVQTMAYDYPESLFKPKVHRRSRRPAESGQIELASQLIQGSKKPVIIAGGGVHYSLAFDALREFADKHSIPVCETQAGKGALSWDHQLNVGAVGVTGSSASNNLLRDSDCVIAVGTRLGDFTTGSRAMISEDAVLVSVNVASFDSVKHKAQPVVADADNGLRALSESLGAFRSTPEWCEKINSERSSWLEIVDEVTKPHGSLLPNDAELVGAVNRAAGDDSTVVCAAGGLPGDLHKFWNTNSMDGYHMEYGYSCMGYEIAGGIGVKMALPDRDVVVMVGDGSYLMMNSELATSVLIGQKLIVVLVDNGGFGCIHRLQTGLGNPAFNNLFDYCKQVDRPVISFADHAKSLGANAVHVGSIDQLESAILEAKKHSKSTVIVVNSDALRPAQVGGTWWEVAIPEVSKEKGVEDARKHYVSMKSEQLKRL